jgi:hypothetical protein
MTARFWQPSSRRAVRTLIGAALMAVTAFGFVKARLTGISALPRGLQTVTTGGLALTRNVALVRHDDGRGAPRGHAIADAFHLLAESLECLADFVGGVSGAANQLA